jgi:hypothetical protein
MNTSRLSFPYFVERFAVIIVVAVVVIVDTAKFIGNMQRCGLLQIVRI